MKHAYLVVFMLLINTIASAQLPGWNHLQPISVQENSGVQLINYQLQLTINTQSLVTAGDMLSSGDDIRFTSECTGGTNFNYWIESGMNTASTVIWVKLDTLNANAYKTIYMQYGNSIAASVSAVTGTFNGPNSSTDSVASGAAGGVTDSQRGFRFSPNETILVTSFGKLEPTGTQRYVTLFDFNTQAILQQTQVNGPAGQYSYSNISSPIWLTQGTQYLLELFQGSSDGYYFGNSSQIGQHLTYYDMRYCNGCTQNTFPTNTLSNYQYGYPDLWYFTKNNAAIAPTVQFQSYQSGIAANSVYVCLGDSVQLAVSPIGGQLPFTYSWTNTAIDDATSATPTVFPSNSMTYYITITDGCGVMKTDSVEVEVKALPAVTVGANPAVICNGESSDLTVSGAYTYYWSTGDTTTTITVSPSVTSTYMVTATDVFMCQSENSVDVTVNIPLTATHTISLCFGESYQVGSNTYTMSGTYVDTLAGITSCDSIVTTNLTVPATQLTSTHNVSICFGSSYLIGGTYYSTAGVYTSMEPGAFCDTLVTTNLSVENPVNAGVVFIDAITLQAQNPADSYQWVDCNNNFAAIPGETNMIFQATVNGSYAVICTVGNCFEMSDCVDILLVGLDEITSIENISVSPNPSNGLFNVSSTISQTVTVLNAVGQVVRTVDLVAEKMTQVDLSGEAAGIFFLKSKGKMLRLVVE